MDSNKPRKLTFRVDYFFGARSLKHKEVAKHLLDTNIVIANEVSDINFPAESNDAALYMHMGEVRKRLIDYAIHLQRTSNSSNEEKEEIKNADKEQIWKIAEEILIGFTGTIYQGRLAEEVSKKLDKNVNVNDLSRATNDLGKRARKIC